MKMKKAMEIIDGHNGFMVSFEHVEKGLLTSDHFPDKHAGEELIKTASEAWRLAQRFAAKTKGRCVNIYVVDDSFCPVKGYEKKKIINR